MKQVKKGTPPPEYHFIRAWGKWLGSNYDYIEHQVALATDFGAPERAIYWQADREKWSVWEDIKDPLVRKCIWEMASEYDPMES
jgi:hypothetical protein